ncbi:membrane-spanning 4-domains subfamily A member 4A-like isoform X2 [Xyrauchen texanus]|uniref:membrane-spanning 4-domains subfamily A member 4A-like isoform X2 n=1 Tax=Xyrauchen texanus TaxID=154827 RepID=UPI002242851B|nr:membrane-spanning 4-domains subfamily A member 4A-like isoform X2 [Xyrauchen texanus]
MRYTFKPDDCMVITIPLASIRNMNDGQLMPEKFTCVFKDAYKVFLKGRPKELGAAQLSIGIFVICVGALMVQEYGSSHLTFTLPSALFILSGILTFAAGSSPFMPVVKLSFIFNIISLFWAIAALVICPLLDREPPYRREDSSVRSTERMFIGLKVVVSILCVFELILALILIFWESKAVCKPHFNTLPLISIKQEV